MRPNVLPSCCSAFIINSRGCVHVVCTVPSARYVGLWFAQLPAQNVQINKSRPTSCPSSRLPLTSNSCLLLATAIAAPDSTNDGRTKTGKPTLSEKDSASFGVLSNAHLG